MSAMPNTNLAGFIENNLAIPQGRTKINRELYEQHKYRLYALAMSMSDDEPAAEELLKNVFCRAFGINQTPTADEIDRCLIAEIRLLVPLGELTLDCGNKNRGVRRPASRAEMKRAVEQLPHTERLIFLMHDVLEYDHARIARALGLAEDESCRGLHQARLRLRELLTN